MRKLAVSLAAALLTGAGGAGPAVAQTASAPAPAPVSQQAPVATLDPNEVICERQPEIGSRLAHRRVCMTRSQWQDTRRQDREAVEKAQMQRGMGSGG